RLLQVSSNPDSVGSVGTSSRRAEPGTYRNPAGKLSTSAAPWTAPLRTLVTVMVYGTSCPRVTWTSGVVLLTVSAPSGMSNTTETLAEAVCGGLSQVTTPVLVTVVPVASVLPSDARKRRSIVAPGASGP